MNDQRYMHTSKYSIHTYRRLIILDSIPNEVVIKLINEPVFVLLIFCSNSGCVFSVNDTPVALWLIKNLYLLTSRPVVGFLLYIYNLYACLGYVSGSSTDFSYKLTSMQRVLRLVALTCTMDGHMNIVFMHTSMA